jgi:hypothetical protein
MNTTFLYKNGILLDKCAWLTYNKIYTEDTMGKAFVYIDNSNVFIEGCRVSAVNNNLWRVRGIEDAMSRRLTDNTWNLDYIEFHKVITSIIQLPIASIKLWASPPPQNPFWNHVRSAGFDITIFDKNIFGREKKIDTAITYQIAKDSYTGIINKEEDGIFLLSGDCDYADMISDLTLNGFKFNIIFWDHAGIELKEAASEFISLNPYFNQLTKNKETGIQKEVKISADGMLRPAAAIGRIKR